MVSGSSEPAANEVRENTKAGEAYTPTQTSDAKEEQGPSPARADKTRRSMTVSNDELARRRQEVKILKEQISGKRHVCA